MKHLDFSRHKYFAVFCLASLYFLFFSISPTSAHGTIITLTIPDPPTIHINALYDTGDPMSEAQILVYAPDNPRQAWHTGIADLQGNYQFKVDTTLSGEWALTIRTAGHGEIRHLYIARNGTITFEQSAKRPFWQTALLATAVVLTLLTIAWYYASQGEKKDAHS